MKKRLILFIFLAGLSASAALAEEADSSAFEPKRLRDSLFSVSSDEFDASESLNRVAGHIDLGFAGPAQTYKSSDHYTPGPFGREKAESS